ncbi:hypothetical protein BS78_07G166600 [Paspalum vaginatum]|nr:hypothetical protein BS78_07G166600 [Paspalum vaginatum]
MGNCSPSPRRPRPTDPGSPPLDSTVSAPTVTVNSISISPYALARSPSVSATAVDAEDAGVVRVYGSDGCPPRGASASRSSTRRRRPSTSRPPRRPRSAAPCSASPPPTRRSAAPPSRKGG